VIIMLIVLTPGETNVAWSEMVVLREEPKNDCGEHSRFDVVVPLKLPSRLA